MKTNYYALISTDHTTPEPHLGGIFTTYEKASEARKLLGSKDERGEFRSLYKYFIYQCPEDVTVLPHG